MRTVNQEAISQLRQAASLVIVSHVTPDGDALGSSLGLAQAAIQHGKRVTVVNGDGVPEWLRFLPGTELIQNSWPSVIPDLYVLCDCGDLARIGEDLVATLPANAKILNVDHHISNRSFGSWNIVEPHASSTAEVVYGMVRELGWPIDAAVAKCLLTGIVSDTGRFRYRSTTKQSLQIASELFELGDLSALTEQLYGEFPRSMVVLHAAALQRIEFFADRRIAVIVVDESLYEQTGATTADVEGLAERARDIRGVAVAIVLRAVDGYWKVGLRGKGGHVNLATIAGRFGGGGHHEAAAFRWRRGVAEGKSEVLAAVQEVLAG